MDIISFLVLVTKNLNLPSLTELSFFLLYNTQIFLTISFSHHLCLMYLLLNLRWHIVVLGHLLDISKGLLYHLWRNILCSHKEAMFESWKSWRNQFTKSKACLIYTEISQHVFFTSLPFQTYLNFRFFIISFESNQYQYQAILIVSRITTFTGILLE